MYGNMDVACLFMTITYEHKMLQIHLQETALKTFTVVINYLGFYGRD